MLIPLLLLAAASTPWDGLIKANGLKPEQVQVPATKWREGGKYALADFNSCWDDWRKLEPTTRRMSDQLLKEDPVASLEMAGRALGLSFSALPKIQTRLGTDLDVPREINEPESNLETALKLANKEYQKSVDSIHDIGDPKSLADEALAFAKSYDLGPHSLALMDHFDPTGTIQAARILAKAVRDAHLEKVKPGHYFAREYHPNGWILISGEPDIKVDVTDCVLAIVTGPRSTIIGKPVTGCAVIIATGDETTFQDCGLAIFGTSIVEGLGRHNHYVNKDCGAGAAVFGTSLLVDGGNSTFEGRQLVEGAAVDGVALLLNKGGQNRYTCLTCGQGFAGPKGFGALVDREGQSSFVADDTKIDNPSPQSAQHNVSMAQGAGFGRRANPGDGHSMAGGIGLLVNGGGKNQYSCGVFGQGVGYWYGYGALVNYGPSNDLKGVWYVQGSAAHYALGCLLALGGKDKFEATTAQSLGQGHDYSIGLLHSYRGHSLFQGDGGGMLGSGRWNGIGLFAAEGPNELTAGGESFGFVADHRPEEGCFGLFFAPKGQISKSADPRIATGKKWQLQFQAKPLLLGAGAT